MKKLICFYIVLLVLGTQSACAAVQIASQTGNIIPQIADGQVTGIQAGTALLVIRQAVNGAVGTQIMAQGDKLMFAYSTEYGWAFVAVNVGKGVESALGKVSVFGGSIANLRTTRELIEYLKTRGWEPVTESYPAVQAVKAALGNGAGILSGMAGSLTTMGMVVLPVHDEKELMEFIGYREVIQ